MKSWLLTKLFGTKPSSVGVGSRVKYQGVEGTVTGGCLYVKFDRRGSFMSKKTGDKHLTVAFNIDKQNLEVL